MVTHFITICEARYNMLEFQYEENIDFEKYLRTKIPNKHIYNCGVEVDSRWNRRIKYLQIHKKYWTWINKETLKYFINAWAFKRGNTYNLKTMKKLDKNTEINFV